jgi:hypothetical protein
VVKRLLFGFATVALAVASAAPSYSVTFYDPVVINGSKLQPGNYKVEYHDNTATITQGKTVMQAPVKVETGDQKFRANTVRMDGTAVQEIRLGGTNTKLVFEQNGDATK